MGRSLVRGRGEVPVCVEWEWGGPAVCVSVRSWCVSERGGPVLRVEWGGQLTRGRQRAAPAGRSRWEGLPPPSRGGLQVWGWIGCVGSTLPQGSP